MSLLLPHISSFVLWVPSELVWVAARIQVVQGGTGGGTENGKWCVSRAAPDQPASAQGYCIRHKPTSLFLLLRCNNHSSNTHITTALKFKGQGAPLATGSMHNRLVTPAVTEGSSAGTGTQHWGASSSRPRKGCEELIPSLLLNGTTRGLSSLPPSPTDKHTPQAQRCLQIVPQPSCLWPWGRAQAVPGCARLCPAAPHTFPVGLCGVHQQNVSRSTTDIWPIIPLQWEHSHVRHSSSSLRPGLTWLGFRLTQSCWHCSQHKLGHGLQCWDNPGI